MIGNFYLIHNACAEVSLIPAVKDEVNGSGQLARIKIYGEIKQEDVRKFKLMQDLAKKSSEIILIDGIYFVTLDSQGGSVSAAISIGKEIRVANLGVIVGESAKCVSACVLVLAGGVTRAVGGLVGIHRPHVVDDKAYTVGNQKQSYEKIEKNVKDYLSYVNVPTSLYDVMFRIPPEKVRWLSNTELQEFNLNEADPYYKEAEDAVLAKKAGITKSEFIKRKLTCERSYSITEEMIDCYVKQGLINY